MQFSSRTFEGLLLLLELVKSFLTSFFTNGISLSNASVLIKFETILYDSLIVAMIKIKTVKMILTKFLLEA